MRAPGSLLSESVGPAALRDEFPVLARVAYLNAGTDGPLADRAVSAARAELERQAAEGRWTAHFERRRELNATLRDAYAARLGCEASDVALTTCTSEGLSTVLSGLELDPGDEILTSDEEHPGLLGALLAARELRGATVRLAPLVELADAVGPRTRLVACSHVSWTSGRLAPTALAELDVPVVLDGAQGVGAIPVDVRALGCDAYAGSGQKWMCGPDGIGMLYTTPELRSRLRGTRRGYANLSDANAGLEARLHEDARALDTFSLGAEVVACALAATAVLDDAGWAAVHDRARGLAARLAELLRERGREVAPRGDTTLVSFSSADPPAERGRLGEAGVVVRDLPGRPVLRASVGAWNDDGDLERLMDALA
jgi:selenocysteine lyase/cysteine desulfurase